MTVYERLQGECEKKGISITALCLEVTGNKGNLATWKRNNGHMRSEYLAKCAKILNVSTDYLLGNTPEQNVNSVSGNNNNVIGIAGHNNAPVSICGEQTRPLTTQEKDLLRVYTAADGKQQMKIMNLIYQIDDELSEKNN